MQPTDIALEFVLLATAPDLRNKTVHRLKSAITILAIGLLSIGMPITLALQ
jgi:hypothetical protein